MYFDVNFLDLFFSFNFEDRQHAGLKFFLDGIRFRENFTLGKATMRLSCVEKIKSLTSKKGLFFILCFFFVFPRLESCMSVCFLHGVDQFSRFDPWLIAIWRLRVWIFVCLISFWIFLADWLNFRRNFLLQCIEIVQSNDQFVEYFLNFQFHLNYGFRCLKLVKIVDFTYSVALMKF